MIVLFKKTDARSENTTGSRVCRILLEHGRGIAVIICIHLEYANPAAWSFTSVPTIPGVRTTSRMR